MNDRDAARILIIDDEFLIRRALADYLADYGYVTVTAADGAEGLAKARAEKFHVVLTDLRMPYVDGLEVISTLRAEQPALPVVVISGTGVLSDAIGAIRRGAWDYVTKPIRDMGEVVVVVEQVLEKARLIAERDRYQHELEQLNRSLEAEVARQTQDLRARNRDLTVLNRVIASAVTTRDPVKVLHMLCTELALAFNVPHAAAIFINPEHVTTTIAAEYCEPAHPSVLGVEISLTQAAIAHVLEHQQPLFIADAQTDARLDMGCEALRRHGIVSLLLVPLRVQGQVNSMLGLGSGEPRTYTLADLNLIQNAAAAAAQTLEAIELHQELEEHAEALEATVAQRTAELQVALKQARAADEAKSQFLSNVSHELRTPLASIRLCLRLLDQDSLHQRQRYLDSLANEVERLQTLIEGLLDISRLDLGKTQPQLQRTDLNQLLGILVFDREKLFVERNLQLRLIADRDLPAISADPKLLGQVATNLLTNAMNYTPAGGMVCLSTERVEVDGEHWVTFSVQDTGLGIPVEEQPHLFERFFRGAAGRTSSAPGTGLGLAISKEIVDLHRGRITLTSEEGEGSIFTVWLPCESE